MTVPLSNVVGLVVVFRAKAVPVVLVATEDGLAEDIPIATTRQQAGKARQVKRARTESQEQTRRCRLWQFEQEKVTRLVSRHLVPKL